MIHKTVISTDPSRILRKSHAGVMEKMERLNNALKNLRYEGKASFGKNLKAAGAFFKSFSGELARDMDLEEKYLFPYLEAHLPKLAFMIHVLEEEHEDIKRNLTVLRSLLADLSRGGYDGGGVEVVEKVRRKAAYVNYFLHNHTLAENESVYRVMEAELSPPEKEELCSKLA